MKKAFILKILLVGGLVVLTMGQACDVFRSSTDDSGGGGSTGVLKCPLGASGLQSPGNISEVIQLVNSLPKPLSLICFLANLEGPLEVYAVNSTFSAQNSPGPESPRIFIFNDNLILSVLPAGSARNKLELGFVISSSRSIKGEIEFPVLENLPDDEAYLHILNEGGASTSCQFCHLPERRYAGNSFESELIAPDGFARVRSEFMREQALDCSLETDRYRCGMIKTIFLDRQGHDVLWPY